jgi:hypothetical protein
MEKDASDLKVALLSKDNDEAEPLTVWQVAKDMNSTWI